MATSAAPQGLAFVRRLAELVCGEYQFSHSWSVSGDDYALTVECRGRTMTFHFDRAMVDRPGSNEYREVVEEMLDRLLKEFRQEA